MASRTSLSTSPGRGFRSRGSLGANDDSDEDIPEDFVADLSRYGKYRHCWFRVLVCFCIAQEFMEKRRDESSAV